MKLLPSAFVWCATVLASGSEPSPSDFLAFDPPALVRFGITQAQASADAQRIALHGTCGMSVFKEKRGPIWIFETKIGYGSAPAPDICIVEPAIVLPKFGVQHPGANQLPRRSAGSCPSSGGSSSFAGPTDDRPASETPSSPGPRG